MLLVNKSRPHSLDTLSDVFFPTSNLPDTSLKTPVILKRPQPGVSAEMSNTQVNTLFKI